MDSRKEIRKASRWWGRGRGAGVFVTRAEFTGREDLISSDVSDVTPARASAMAVPPSDPSPFWLGRLPLIYIYRARTLSPALRSGNPRRTERAFFN